MKDIIKEIEVFGECFIGTLEVQGVAVFKKYERVCKEFNKIHPEAVLAYDSVTGICWETA